MNRSIVYDIVENFNHTIIIWQGLGWPESWLNTQKDSNMVQYLLPMARNLVTGQTVKTQDLTGNRFELRQRALAEDSARQLAERMSSRTNQQWQGFVQIYTPSVRKS